MLRAHAATGGELARSRKWREILEPYGVGDELRCVAADEYGAWGDFAFFRDSDQRPFDAEDAQFMRVVSSVLASALRRAMVAPSAGAPGAHRARPGSCSWMARYGPAARRTPPERGSRRSTRRRLRTPRGFQAWFGMWSAGCSRSSAARILNDPPRAYARSRRPLGRRRGGAAGRCRRRHRGEHPSRRC